MENAGSITGNGGLTKKLLVSQKAKRCKVFVINCHTISPGSHFLSCQCFQRQGLLLSHCKKHKQCHSWCVSYRHMHVPLLWSMCDAIFALDTEHVLAVAMLCPTMRASLLLNRPGKTGRWKLLIKSS